MKSSAVVLSVVFLLQPFTHESKASAQEASEPKDDSQRIARELFMKGRVAYDLGNYDEAIAKFQGAYEQMQEPAFLFNIAQAYRLKNDCSRAIDAYRNFLRIGRQSENRDAAESHLSDLRRTCAESRPTSVQTVPAVKNEGAVTSFSAPLAAGDSGSGTRPFGRRLSTIGFAGSAIVGSIAIGLGIWNLDRYNDWSAENDQLSNPPSGSNAQMLASRQNANDDRLSSIQKAETVTWGLALGAGVLVLGSLVLRIVSER